MTYLVPVACAAILLITFAFAGYPLVAGCGRLAIQSDRGRLGMQLLRKRDQLYAAIKELDFDRSLDKVLEEDYASQRRGLDREAVAVLAQLDQLERRTDGKSSVVWQIERDVEELRIWTERKDSQLIKIHADLNNLAHRIVEEQRLYAQKPEEKSGVIRVSDEKLNNDFSEEITEEKLKAEYVRNEK